MKSGPITDFGGGPWVCIGCGETFDDRQLLNMHWSVDAECRKVVGK